jgi:hypothetical protein
MTVIFHRPSATRLIQVCADRARLSVVSDGLRMELTSHTGNWVIELTRAECEHIAEEIGYRRPGVFRPEVDADS